MWLLGSDIFVLSFYLLDVGLLQFLFLVGKWIWGSLFCFGFAAIQSVRNLSVIFEVTCNLLLFSWGCIFWYGSWYSVFCFVVEVKL